MPSHPSPLSSLVGASTSAVAAQSVPVAAPLLSLAPPCHNLWDDAAAADGDRSSVDPPSRERGDDDDDDEHSINTAKDKFHSIAFLSPPCTTSFCSVEEEGNGPSDLQRSRLIGPNLANSSLSFVIQTCAKCLSWCLGKTIILIKDVRIPKHNITI